MNLNKELPKEIQEAYNKLREGAAELDKALHVPRETDEVKKLKETNNLLGIVTSVAIMCFVASCIGHGIRSMDNNKSWRAMYMNERDKNMYSGMKQRLALEQSKADRKVLDAEYELMREKMKLRALVDEVETKRQNDTKKSINEMKGAQ